MPTKKEKQTFEERLDALEELVKRMEEGGVRLGTLPEGKWRYLTEEEVEKLKK